MEYERIFTWTCFFFSLGLTATAVLVFFKEKESRRFKPLLLLQYFLILICAFGFYSLWSGILYQQIFDSYSEPEKTRGVSSFLALLGTPFLLVGLVCLVFWAAKFSKKKPTTLLYSGGFITTLVVIMVYFSFQDFNWRLDIQQVYALLLVTVIFLLCLFLAFSPVHYFNFYKKNLLILFLFLIGAIHLPLFFITQGPILKSAFAFLFFLTNTGFCLFFIYSVKPFLGKEEVTLKEVTFEFFFQKHGITPRESEIILEIYNGKTNKEIAEKLFVTVQTVKDHTHRIYQKTAVKNRTQLASVLREYQ